ncbi:hypothetical protein [Geobacter sp. SVR]|uniref:hypothetical protein n=1 Tax=Geobacter sp. SVR TaxID=2495594 RepID=UPI00143EFE53|nr:hypothetical protein [Geobacter sp. SVR]BCS55316.1 hypothetical protein GSVR_36240 [Geobacter sp. SVR]GCF87241.1 hypothetical protein GSbR_38410 [Geobacter sp. SVR]
MEVEKEFAGKGGTKRTYLSLQAEVIAFSDQYTARVWEEMDKILEKIDDPTKRIALKYRRVSLISSVMRVAADRNPAANLLDMVVFITLQRMVVEEYWIPKVYGPEAKDLVGIYMQFEKEIWSLAGEMLSPGQLRELRDMIKAWRAAHPQQYYVTDVRLKELTGLRGKYPGERTQEVDSLLGQMQKSLEKVDEALLTAERAMFYFQRMPRIMTLQTDLLMDQVAVKPEVRQLEDEVGRLTKAFENASQTFQSLPGTVNKERRETIRQLTDWLDKEHERLVSDVEANEPLIKDTVVELRLALAVGNDLVKSIDVLTARLHAQRLEDGSPPIDYVKTLDKASEMARQLKELVVMMNAFVAGEEAEEKPAALSKALSEINTRSESVLNHIFFLAAGLILLFFVCLLCYRYLVRRLDSPRASG